MFDLEAWKADWQILLTEMDVLLRKAEEQARLLAEGLEEKEHEERRTE